MSRMNQIAFAEIIETALHDHVIGADGWKQILDDHADHDPVAVDVLMGDGYPPCLRSGQRPPVTRSSFVRPSAPRAATNRCLPEVRFSDRQPDARASELPLVPMPIDYSSELWRTTTPTCRARPIGSASNPNTLTNWPGTPGFSPISPVGGRTEEMVTVFGGSYCNSREHDIAEMVRRAISPMLVSRVGRCRSVQR